MALVANNYFIMFKSKLFALLLVISYLPSSSYGLTKNFVNTSMPDMRPTFVVNFDMATVICQHSDNPEDLHLHEISILCDGKNDCFNNPAMDDESFPYCEGKCNSTCNDRGACLYDGEKAQCYCNSGYHGPSCEVADINECQDEPCHWLAKCTNTINSTKCDCFPGFKGNGFDCTDVDECAENLANCPEYSQCVNLPGTYFCNCTSGFMPKSALMPTCIDIDECSTDMHNCNENEFCQNTFGSFECVKECSKGYQLNGTICDDVDECSESHSCDKRATCENTNGGYKCICDEGFTGDGHSCSPITDCSKNENICHRHGFCIASLKMCICETGYAGDGLACHDINECETSENPCKDQSDNKCVNIEGGYICCDSKLNDEECIEEKGAYCSGGCGLHAICFNQTCTCVDGFEGDPKVKCNDVNECEDESICPGVGQWCVNMIGGHICCGRDSTHPECKGLEINAFNGNFGKGSISNAQLTEARSRGFFTHIIEKGERQENSSGGVVVVVRGNESDSSGEAISSNGITFSFEIPTCNDNQNTTICPSNSECKQGRCTCIDGFEWSRSSGSCIDIDECEKLSQPCLIGADVWCVNIIGSYQCCNKSSSESECLGLEISAVDISTGNGGLHTSGSDETTKKKKNQWVIETLGEWRNVSGGRAIIIEGKLASNFTETSTSSSTTVKGVSEIIHLPSASFVTIPDSEENGAEIKSEEETSKSTEITSTAETIQTTISANVFDISTTNAATVSSIVADSFNAVTTPLIPKAAPEQIKSTNPITKILENLGIITTKKVTSKPVMLITAGPNSIEALDLNAPKEESSTLGYSESTSITDESTSTTTQDITTSTLSIPVTKTTKKKVNSKTKNSKKFKTTLKLTKTTTTQPATTFSANVESTVTPPGQASTSDSARESSTINDKTTRTTSSFSTTTTEKVTTTPRIVDDSELSRSTNNVEKEITTNIWTSKATESASTSLPPSSTPLVKIASKKKTKKPSKTTKAIPKNITKLQTSTTTTRPNKNLSTTSLAGTTFSTKATENDSFEMEVMVTMRSTTEKDGTTQSSPVTKQHSTGKTSSTSFLTTTDKGIEKTNDALPTTITPMHLSTEFDIFIPNTPPTIAQPQILINQTFFEHNFTTTSNISTDSNLFTTSTVITSPENFEESESIFTTAFKSSTTLSTFSIKKLFPLPPDINFELISPEDITAQKLYTPSSTPHFFEINRSVSDLTSFPNLFTTSPSSTTEEMSDTVVNKTVTSNFPAEFSTTEERNFTTLPYPRIPFDINQQTTFESSTISSLSTSSVETFTPTKNTTSFTDTSTAFTVFIPPIFHSNEITSTTFKTSSPVSQQNFQPFTVTTNILGSTTENYPKVSTDNLTNNNKFKTSTNMPLITDITLSSAFSTKRRGMEMIFVDETTDLVSTDLTTLTPNADLTDIPNDSTSNEVVTSGEKGLEISVITTPFKQGSSTEIPDSGEMGLEISGKSSTSESEQPKGTTNIAETSTSVSLPETEIENPESGEHLTQEEIEKLKRIIANETSTSTVLVTTVNPTSTQSSIATTTEDLSKVKSGEMGLELSGVTTPSSAEEFTSEPATAVSTTSEIEKPITSQIPDLTTESPSSVSTTAAEISGEQSTLAEKASTVGVTSSATSKIPPKSHEASFEKIPKSGEVGLEIGGNGLSGITETTVAPDFTSEIQSTTPLKTTEPSETPTPEKVVTNVSEETSTSASSTLLTTQEKEQISEKSTTSAASETTSLIVETGTTSATTSSETATDETKIGDTSPSLTTEETKTSTTSSLEKTLASTAQETTTISSTPTTPENERPTDLPFSATKTVSSETTTAKEASTVETTQLTTEINAGTTESTITSSPTPLTSPSTVQSEISTTPSGVSEEKSSTTSGETGLELSGKEFTTTALASSTATAEESKEETTTIAAVVTEPTAAETYSSSLISSSEAPTTTAAQSITNEPSTEKTKNITPTSLTSQTSETSTTSGTATIESLSTTSSSTLAPTTPAIEGSTLNEITTTEETTSDESTTISPSQSSSLAPELTNESSTPASKTEAATAQTSTTTESTLAVESTLSATSSSDKSTFVPDKVITDVTNSVTDSFTNPTSSVATTTPQSSDSTLSAVQTTENASTGTPSTLSVSTTESIISGSPLTSSTKSPTVSTEVTTELPATSSESPSTSTETATITTTFEPTYATYEASVVFTSTEPSVTDTLPTSENSKLTENPTTAKDQTSIISTEVTTPLDEVTETSGDDGTTVHPSTTTPELLPPDIIVDKSRSHEEIDEGSQLRHTSTAQPVTTFTTAETPPFTAISKTKCLSNDECEKDAYCERRSGACRCKPGFEGEPPQHQCQDIDECKQNLDDCHSSSRCLNYIGGYHCVCAIGYRKNANGVCEDVDECSLSNGTICDPHAVCRNLPGAYLCECNAGYTGDGYNCISIEKRHCNQNDWAKSDCGRNHFCLVDGNGKIDCDVCKNGFIMKNGICSDVNECEENSKLCHSDAICQNIMGGYQCRCQPGYSGDGHNCQDIDECGIQNSCHPQATCVNTPGSFMCECPEGWTGDGKNACLNPADQKCSQRSEICKNGRENSACLSLKVGDKFESACECLPNYRYNSTTSSCDDIDECSENRDNCDTANSVCVNTVGGFQCHCAAGYEGSGGICVDIDECKRGLAGCHVNAHCINRIGGVECRCGAGYTGDGTDCFPLDNRQIGGSDCNEDWVNMCRSQNKTCHIDDEEVPQCGSCMFGYQPMDGKCQPINALGNCADPSKNDCDANAECIDVRPGRHFCSCKIGFIGDGMHCDDVDECSIPRLCDFHATCKNTNGSYECQCKEGFIGNGFKCVPANQSQNCRISPEICHTNAGCQPDGTCKCLRGYEGDGVSECKRTSVTDSYDENETSTSRRPYYTTESFFTSTITDRHCSARDRTACHVLATCDLDLGECVCRQGFMGDGYIACTRIWEDCTADKNMCHTNATCDNETKQCQCNIGFIGDGVSCVPDKMDCIIRPNLCSEMAECVARRCVCGPGFTGDGSICMPVEPPQFIAGNCSLCHIQAICANGGCRCGQGCFGNGALCVPDPEDCINYPGVCHMNGYCDTNSRRCSCKKGFAGNGLDCSKRISCTTDSSICHKEATCLSDGRCECNHGLMGDGVECLKPLTAAEIFGTSAPQLIHFECPSSCGSNAECINGACKCSPGYIANENSLCIDIDECKMQTAQCNAHAKCINQEGTYECRCLAGYSGNGKECSTAVLDNPDGLKVECKDDGLNVVLVEETSSFNGRIFVRGQSENPYCTKTFNGSEALPLSFHVPISHCDMQLEANDTLAVTVIIQKHPLFVTEQAYAYRIKCTYPTATRNIMSHYNISEITTVETINTKGVEPACQLTVTNERNVTVDSAIVGQVLKLALFVLPNDSFTVLPRNCYAINLETSQRYTLTDEAGCAIDAQLFPEWTRINPSLTHAIFRTFKWPDSSMIRFECDCSACVADCPEINCERRREEQKAKMRFARDNIAVGILESQDALWLKNSQTITKPVAAYSAVVLVMDDAEEQLAQKQVEEWLSKGNSHESEFFSNLDEDRICVSAPWAGLSLFSIILSISLLLTMSQIYKKRISKKKAELQNRASNFNDNNSAYIKF